MHVRNKGLLEKICQCCTERCDMTRRESRYYVKFREEMVASYSEEDPEHEVGVFKLHIYLIGSLERFVQNGL
jgi:hypothetical protein